MTCLNCKYYLSPNRDRMFCGLGMSPRDAQTENFCSKKEEGIPEVIKFKKVSIWDYEKDKRLEQCPNSVKNLCKKLEIKLYKFKRSQKNTSKSIREITIELWLSSCYSWEEEEIGHMLSPNSKVSSISNTHTYLQITYTQSKREAFIAKKLKKGKL